MIAYPNYPQYDPMSEFGLAHNTNRFMNTEANISLANNLPGYVNNAKQSASNTSNWLHGQVPEDVLRLLWDNAAERGISTGLPGSMNANASYLRALGLTSLDLMGKGEQAFSAAVERTPLPQLYNPASAFVPRQNAYDELRATMMGTNHNRGGLSTYRSSGPAFSSFYS